MQEREVSRSTSYPVILPLDLIEKQETKQIKVKMPDGTNFGMAAFAYGTNKDYLVHVIAVRRIIKKKDWCLIS
jgi:hypothetical protein